MKILESNKQVDTTPNMLIFRERKKWSKDVKRRMQEKYDAVTKEQGKVSDN